MKKYLYALLLISLLSSTRLYCPSWILNAPGNYTINNDTVYAPTGPNDSIIEISSSNVVFDLQLFKISQDPTTLPTVCNGIVVDPGLSNITIKNGTIAAITGTGIGIGQGCNSIIITNITTASCDLRALSCNGLPTSPIQALNITNLVAGGCGEGANGDFIFSFSECRNMQINNCRMALNGITSHSLSGVLLYDITQSMFTNVDVGNNIAKTILRGFDCTGLVNCVFNNCVVANTNVLPNSTVVGFDLQNSCTNNRFTNCLALNQIAHGASSAAYGYRLQTGNYTNYFNGCVALNPNSDASASGFFSSGNTYNAFINCIVEAATSSAGNVIGYSISDTGAKLINCLASDGMAGGSATGFNYTSCYECYTQQCQALNYLGATDGQTFGFAVDAGSSRNAFIQNIASFNGSSNNTGNQFSGINSFSQTIVSTSSSGPGNVTSPWTNIGLL